MEKVKGIFSKIGSAVKSHLKLIIAIVAVVVIAIVALSLVGGAEKRIIKKHLSALNSYEKDKVLKTIDLEGALAWSQTSEDKMDEFKDNLEDVDLDDDYKDKVKDSMKKSLKYSKKSKAKYKLIKIVNVATSKENKDIKRVVAKVKVTRKPSKDDDDDDDDDNKAEDYWKGLKDYSTSTTGYCTFILYKNKIISSELISTYASSYDYDWDFDY